MAREIPLWMPKALPGRYFVVLVDDGDYHRVLEAGPWIIVRSATTHYAQRSVPVDGIKRRHCKRELLHRFLMRDQLGSGLEIDHISGDGLDCRRSNMRVITHRENLQNIQRDTSNRKKPKTSRFRGVSWDPRDQRWVAQIAPLGQHIQLGRYDDEVEAARVAAAARAKHFPHANERRHPVEVTA